MLIHVQMLYSAAREKNKTPIAYLSSWHTNIFGYKLRTIEAENP